MRIKITDLDTALIAMTAKLKSTWAGMRAQGLDPLEEAELLIEAEIIYAEQSLEQVTQTAVDGAGSATVTRGTSNSTTTEQNHTQTTTEEGYTQTETQEGGTQTETQAAAVQTEAVAAAVEITTEQAGTETQTRENVQQTNTNGGDRTDTTYNYDEFAD